jgi:hypothetical protein
MDNKRSQLCQKIVRPAGVLTWLKMSALLFGLFIRRGKHEDFQVILKKIRKKF